jgi:hypothetical protein
LTQKEKYHSGGGVGLTGSVLIMKRITIVQKLGQNFLAEYSMLEYGDCESSMELSTLADAVVGNSIKQSFNKKERVFVVIKKSMKRSLRQLLNVTKEFWPRLASS